MAILRFQCHFRVKSSLIPPNGGHFLNSTVFKTVPIWIRIHKLLDEKVKIMYYSCNYLKDWLSSADAKLSFYVLISLHWRHNDHDGVSNHQPHGCLLNRLFRRRSKKTSKLRVTGLCVGNSPGPVNSPHKGPVTRKMFPFDDVIMIRLWCYRPRSMTIVYVQVAVSRKQQGWEQWKSVKWWSSR